MKILIRKKRGSYFLFGIKIKILPKKIGIVFLMSVLLLSFLISCANTPTTTPAPLPVSTISFPALITDQVGRTVSIKTTPQKIVSLAPANTEILFALGLADKIAGVTTYCNYPPEATQKPKIGSFSVPNIEEIVAKSPDLVLASNIHVSKIVPQLEARGLTVLVIDPKTLNEVLDAITLVGKVTGKEKEATTLTSDMQKRVKAVTDKTIMLSSLPATGFVVWHEPLMVAGSGTFHDELMRKAGGINIISAQSGYATVSLETIIGANPAVIIVGIGMGDGGDKPLQFIQTESRLKDIDARKNNRVFAIDQDIVGRTGPRIVDALEQFAKFIHPEIFK
jgi:iron complex transport system substrate-binding protein